ncbi:down syndrome cell adhesion molecule-like protein 1 [Caerostris extrusa]|uniref:Down syndrome cell adhesion molecule-like protein 1 n=1 Tax=Caerostris extrusa TaxID=172846 RepID=A0AAV4WJG2_CAEEX|nr:down syndrome cell adhesion molecule-like protein 1 [Caerostris extrusa]
MASEVTESHSTVPPRITHREEEVKVQLGEIAFLPCAAEAFPVPTHRWYKQESGRTNPIVPSQRVFLMGGTLVFQGYSYGQWEICLLGE